MNAPRSTPRWWSPRSRRSCARQRRNRWPRDHFGLVVVDEAHHTLADSYLNTLRHFHDHAKVLGVTATPDRGDKKNLGRYFQNIACEVTLLDLIQQGWLSPIRVKTVPLGMDLRFRQDHGGRLQRRRPGPRAGTVSGTDRRRAGRTPAPQDPRVPAAHLGFEAVRRTLPRARAEGRTCGRPEPLTGRPMLDRFRRDETRILTNAMLLTEGYDEPSIDCVVCLRPTKVRALYSQIIGRGTRICPGKDHLLVLDFLWQSGEHSLVKPAHLIAEDEEDARALTEKLGDDGDLEEAREEVNADRTRKLAGAAAPPTAAAAAACSTRWNWPSRSTTRIWPSSCRSMQWQGDAPTAKQLDCLAKFGTRRDRRS